MSAMIELSPKVIDETREYIQSTCGFEKLAQLTDLNVEVLRTTFAISKPTRVAPAMISLIKEGLHSLGLTSPQIEAVQPYVNLYSTSIIEYYRAYLN